MIRGPDVSSNNDAHIDWQAVARAGASFAACKASQGDYYRDPTLPHNWVGMKDAGLARIAYHFADPLRCTPDAEAQMFLSQIGHSLEPGDIPALDLEWGDGDLSAWALAWGRTVAQATGIAHPLLYTGGWFAAGRLTDPALADLFHLWDSSWQTLLPAPFAPWKTITLWQWSDAALYPFGMADENLFTGTVAQLRALGKTAPAPPPTPPITPGPTASAYTVRGAMFLRVAPVLNAPGPVFVHKGDHLTAISGWTTHWRHVTTSSGLTGWALASNLAAAA